MLEPGSIEPLRKRITVISPTVTRRPALDAMLGDIAIIAKANLEAMRERCHHGHQLDEDEIKDFRYYSEIVLKQARLEMAVEKHVEERTASMDKRVMAEEVEDELRKVCMKFAVKIEVIDHLVPAVLEAFGLDDG